MSAIERRRFLGAGVAAIVGTVSTRLQFGRGRTGGLQPSTRFGLEPRTAAASPADVVGAYFSNAAGTQRIGAAYLAAYPADGDYETLLGEIAPPDAEPDTWWSTMDQAGLARQIRTRSHRDFASADVVVLDGWQLAHTEARLAALWVQTRT